jgi:hypothetical protein
LGQRLGQRWVMGAAGGTTVIVLGVLMLIPVAGRSGGQDDK